MISIMAKRKRTKDSELSSDDVLLGEFCELLPQRLVDQYGEAIIIALQELETDPRDQDIRALQRAIEAVRRGRAIEAVHWGDDDEVKQCLQEWLDPYINAIKRRRLRGNQNRRGAFKKTIDPTSGKEIMAAPGVLRNAVMRACEESPPSRFDDIKRWVEIKRAVAKDRGVNVRTVSNALRRPPAIKNCGDALVLLHKHRAAEE